MIDAWEQILDFFGTIGLGMWITIYPHNDDGWDYPLQRLEQRQRTAARIDPGVALAQSLPINTTT